VEAKLPELGGNPKVLITEPSITKISLDDKSDFILIGCDGIFDRLDNDEIMKMIWKFKKKGKYFGNIHILSGNIVDAVIKKSMKKLSTDNVSAIFIAFKNFESKMKDKEFEYEDITQCIYIGNEIDFDNKQAH